MNLKVVGKEELGGREMKLENPVDRCLAEPIFSAKFTGPRDLKSH